MRFPQGEDKLHARIYQMLTDAAKVSIVGHDLDREGFRQVVKPLRGSSNAQLSAATTTFT